jgi:RNA polymerase sigma-70 factor, ECF subfamily
LGNKPVEQSELQALVTRAQKGDQEALAQIIQVTQNQLFRFSYYLTGNRQLAQDLCQDTYVRVLDNVKSLKKTDQLQSWMFRTLKNLYLDFIKSSKNKGHVVLEEELPLPSKDDLETVVQMRQMLSQLEPDDRLVLLLLDLEQTPYEEAAAIIGISESALKSRAYRIRQEFIQKYKKS